jgi:hypothetical protein
LTGESSKRGAPDTREYDLRGLRQNRWDVIPYFHAGVLVGGVLLAGWIFYLTYLAWVAGGVPRLVRPQDLFIDAATPVFLAFLGLIFLATRPGATRCTWDSDGITFHYPNGKNARRSWASPRFHLILTEDTSRKGSTYGTHALGLLPANVIPRDLYLDLLQEAQRRELTVTTQSFRAFGTQSTSNDIRGKV